MINEPTTYKGHTIYQLEDSVSWSYKNIWMNCCTDTVDTVKHLIDCKKKFKDYFTAISELQKEAITNNPKRVVTKEMIDNYLKIAA